MKEKAAYLKGLIDGLGIDENTKMGDRGLNFLMYNTDTIFKGRYRDIVLHFLQINRCYSFTLGNSNPRPFFLSQAFRKIPKMSAATPKQASITNGAV